MLPVTLKIQVFDYFLASLVLSIFTDMQRLF